MASFNRQKNAFPVVVNSMHYKDSYPQVNRVDFPYRSTVILKGRIWEVVEVAERAQHEREIHEYCGELTTVVTFSHQEMEDTNNAGTINTGMDDPFLRPRLDDKARKDEAALERQGFGWHGRTLEDGVCEVEDDESEDHMGVQPEAGEGDPVGREPPARYGPEEEAEEIEIEGVGNAWSTSTSTTVTIWPWNWLRGNLTARNSWKVVMM